MTTGFVCAGAPRVGGSAFAGSARVCAVRGASQAGGGAVSARRRRAPPTMGLFGLGFPELAVIAGVGILIFGPSKIAELGKDLGGVAGSVKKASSEFQEAMSDSIAEADREIEQRRAAKDSDGKPVAKLEEEKPAARAVETVEAETEKKVSG